VAPRTPCRTSHHPGSRDHTRGKPPSARAYKPPAVRHAADSVRHDPPTRTTEGTSAAQHPEDGVSLPTRGADSRSQHQRSTHGTEKALVRVRPSTVAVTVPRRVFPRAPIELSV